MPFSPANSGATAGPAPLYLSNTLMQTAGLLVNQVFGQDGTLSDTAIFGAYAGTINVGWSGILVINATGGGEFASITIAVGGAVTITPTGAGPATLVGGTSTVELICTSPDVGGIGQLNLTLTPT